MADPIRGFFEDQIGPNAPPIYTTIEEEERRRVQMAACALLLELAHADDEFTATERAQVDDIIRRAFGLNADGAKQLLELSEAERARGSGMHEFADLIREHFEPMQKTRLLDVMWSLALSDGKIAQHETYFMSRLGELLGVSADQMAASRVRAEGKSAS